MENINRKEAIKRTAAVLGLTATGSLLGAILKGCKSEFDEQWRPVVLNQRQVLVVEDFAEVLLPRTDTPGAKDAKVVRFMDHLLDEFLSIEEKQFILENVDMMVHNGFSDLSFSEQNVYVNRMVENRAESGVFFQRFKQLAMLGFFSSEKGATQVLSYDEIPGIYSGCISLEEAGGKTWAL